MNLTPEYVAAVLESAGRTLAMFPKGFGRPQGHRSGWPEVMKEMVIIVTEDGPEKGLEVIIPDMEIIKPRATIKQITELEMAIDWIQDYALYCKNRNLRVGVVNAMWLGMLHHPITGKRIHDWRKIGKKLTVSHTTAMRWYDDGIHRICAMQNKLSTPPLKFNVPKSSKTCH